MKQRLRGHAVAETEDISDALGAARRVWPDLADKPGALLRRLILVGADTVKHDADVLRRERGQAVADTAGALTGVFGPGYLSELREDWPE